MAAADITTDLFIVVFPIPVIVTSAIPVKKKVSLCMLFSLSTILIVITAYRVPAVIRNHGRQQYRTVWASSEILAAAAVSNAVVIGSFLRDRGLKKAKYKFGSQTDSMDRRSLRRPTLTNHHWASEEDLALAAELGYRLDPELCREQRPRPALPVQPVGSPPPCGRALRTERESLPIVARDYQFPSDNADSSRESEDSTLKPYKPARGSTDVLPKDQPMQSPKTLNVVHPTSNTSFFDVGGLLDASSARSRRSSSTLAPSPTPTSLMNLAQQTDGDFMQARRGSRALLSDIGGLLMPTRGTRRPEQANEWPLHELD
ncbi:MAG: hypothetical protein INR71_12665, partial [Terriglobus roseus]|nr:hypothetical protein [Terriglobus roseus]